MEDSEAVQENASLDDAKFLPSSTDTLATSPITTNDNVSATALEPSITEPTEHDLGRKKLHDYCASLSLSALTKERERALNRTVEYPEESFYSKLDSKLKTCTGYIKKLKNLAESQKEALEKDFQGLNLTRYVSEATQAIAEAKLKFSDVQTALDVSTFFYHRYSEFSSAMLDSWKRVLPSQKGDPVTNPSKLRVDLKLFPEQISLGLLPSKPSLQLLFGSLQILIDSDREDRALFPLINNFVKNFAFEFMGIHPKKIHQLALQHEASASLPQASTTVLSADMQTSFRGLFSKYFDTLVKQIEVENQRLRDLEQAHHRLLSSRGEVPQEKLDKYEEHVATFTKLHANLQGIADSLNRDMPVLKPKAEVEDVRETIEILTVDFGDRAGLAPVWNDEDDRDFYENLPDLKATMPSMAYKDSLKEATDTASQAQSTEDTLAMLDAALAADTNEDTSTATQQETELPSEHTEDSTSFVPPASAPINLDAVPKEKEKVVERKKPLPKKPVIRSKGKEMADLLDTLYEGNEDGEDEPAVLVEDDQESATSVMRQILDAFLASLLKVSSKEAVDKLAVDFTTNLNRRHYRKKLVQALYNVPRTRADLLPLYSRLVAVLNPVMPDVGTELSEAIRRQFRWLVKRQDPLRLESKLRNVRFMAELTKFGVFSRAQCLLGLKILLNNFKHHNVEMACTLLESAGRFLYWSTDSHPRMIVLLDELLRRKTLRLFDARIEYMIENAYLSCCTPETAGRRTASNKIIKIRTPMQMFIRKLFLEDLNRSDLTETDTLMGLLRRLPWNDPEVFEYGVRYLTAAWKINYASISALANILAGLANYQDEMAVRVVDNVLDDVRTHLELNNAKFNQRRLAMVRYLGEMYNYRLVDSSVIFNTLFSLILFGWVGDQPTSLDPPQHLLRLRLVCILLNTCGRYFNHGLSRKKLDSFLALFQRYFWLKREDPVWSDRAPFPMPIVHLVEDAILSARKDVKLIKSLEEAESILHKLTEKLQAKVNLDSLNKSLVVEESAGSTAEGEDDSSEVSSRTGSEVDLTILEQPDLPVEEKEPEPLEQEDMDFMASFEKLASESFQTHAQSKVPQFKSSIPAAVKEQLDKEGPNEPVGEDVQTVRVGLMTKKGAKQHHIRFMEMPEETDYVSHWKATEEHENKERREMMRLTLDMSQRQEREEYEELVGSVTRTVPAPRQDIRAPLRPPHHAGYGQRGSYGRRY